MFRKKLLIAFLSVGLLSAVLSYCIIFFILPGTGLNLIFSFCAVMIIIFILADILSRKITRPILKLNEDSNKIINFELDHKAKIYNNDEIGELAKNFNSMAVTLNEYMQDFGKSVEQNLNVNAELDIAAKIQSDMLPKIKTFPNRDEFDINAEMLPAKEVGGDFYDFFFVDADHIALVMADVSGKGVPAALFMVVAKTLIKNRAQMTKNGEHDPAQILHDVNNQLCGSNESKFFVTVYLGIVEISTGNVIYCNAGHEFPAIEHDGEFKLIETDNDPALGIISDLDFTNYEFKLNPGDSIYLYTDGVTEAINLNEELFGENRMLKALNTYYDESAEEILKSVEAEINIFAKKTPQFDDITMMCFKYFANRDEIEIKADISNLDRINKFLERKFKEYQCSEKSAKFINLACEEIFKNICSYAYPMQYGKVKIKVVQNNNSDIEIKFIDSGIKFNPIETFKIKNGLGLRLTKSIVDHIAYEHDGNRNILTLRKAIK